MTDKLGDALEALYAAQLERAQLAARCRDEYRAGRLAGFLDAFADFAQVSGDSDAIADAVIALARHAIVSTGHRA